MIQKATAKAGTFTNIKPMAGGIAIAQLAGGDYVFGEVGATDVMNFSHFYRNNVRVELLINGVSTLCKATLGNLTLDPNTVEPGLPPPPPPVEPPTTVKRKATWTVEESPNVFKTYHFVEE